MLPCVRNPKADQRARSNPPKSARTTSIARFGFTRKWTKIWSSASFQLGVDSSAPRNSYCVQPESGSSNPLFDFQVRLKFTRSRPQVLEYNFTSTNGGSNDKSVHARACLTYITCIGSSRCFSITATKDNNAWSHWQTENQNVMHFLTGPRVKVIPPTWMNLRNYIYLFLSSLFPTGLVYVVFSSCKSDIHHALFCHNPP